MFDKRKTFSRKLSSTLFLLSIICWTVLAEGNDSGTAIQLKNPGFEEQSEPLRGWILREWSSPAGKPKAELSEDAHTGRYSAKVSWITGGDNILLSQTIRLKGQKRLRLSYYCKVNAIVNAEKQVGCSIITYDKNDKKLQYQNETFNVTSDWKLITFDFTTEDTTENIYIYLRSGKDTVFYDDVVLREISGIAISKTYMWYPSNEIIVTCDLSGQDSVLEHAKLSVELFQEDSDAILSHSELKLTENSDKIYDIILNMPIGAKGKYKLLAKLVDNNKRILSFATDEIKWPEAVDETNATGRTKRNNFVSDLLELQNCNSHNSKYEFTNPREGWVYVESAVDEKDAKKTELWLCWNGQKKLLYTHKENEIKRYESMQFLPKGKALLHIVSKDGEKINSVKVRSIPEIVLTEYQSEDINEIKKFKKFSQNTNVAIWNFARERLKNLMATPEIKAEIKKEIDAWRNSGKKVVTLTLLPEMPNYQDWGFTKQQLYSFWASEPGLVYYDGIVPDEFGHETQEHVPYFIDAVQRISTDERFKGKKIYAYCPIGWGTHKKTDEFRKLLIKNGHRFSPELYLREQASLTEAKKDILYWAEYLKLWETRLPGSMANSVIILSSTSKYVYGQNTHPNVDYKVFLDLQMNYLANDPLFNDLGGISAWILRYADDETIEWLSALYRHYCIDGKKTLLSDEYGFKYRLDFIKNPSFVDGFKDWVVNPATAESILSKNIPGYGFARGTCTSGSSGDSVLIMKKNSLKPNSISQVVYGLQVGKLYSIKLYTSDYRDITNGASKPRKHDIDINMENVNWVKDDSEIYRSTHSLKSVPGNLALNYHYKVFRANSTESKIIISDWNDKVESGVNRKQELVINFVELQPFFSADTNTF